MKKGAQYLIDEHSARIAMRIFALLSCLITTAAAFHQPPNFKAAITVGIICSTLGIAGSLLESCTRAMSNLLGFVTAVLYIALVIVNGLVPAPLAVVAAAIALTIMEKRIGIGCAVIIIATPLVYATAHPESVTPIASRTLVVAPIVCFVFFYFLNKTNNRSKELEKIAQELAISNSDISQMVERQKEMFAVIGHELRTPVASMAMVAKDSDTSDASARQHMESISSNLLSILEDLRVVVAPERALESKLEVGHPANKVERAISPLKPMIEEAGFSVSLDLPAKVEKHYHLHAQPLRQLVTNLVKNAVVHSGGDQVQVKLTLNEDDETQTQATLRISDNGKGLTKAEQEHVFEAFGRGDTSSDGSGLGLFIVGQLIKKMDGSLSYETSKLGGACFEVSFPMQVAEQAQAQAQDILSGLNILLAEDDSFLAQLTQKMLSAKGANVTVAENGQIALDAFKTEAFDVVITDLMMPE